MCVLFVVKLCDVITCLISLLAIVDSDLQSGSVAKLSSVAEDQISGRKEIKIDDDNSCCNLPLLAVWTLRPTKNLAENHEIALPEILERATKTPTAAILAANSEVHPELGEFALELLHVLGVNGAEIRRVKNLLDDLLRCVVELIPAHIQLPDGHPRVDGDLIVSLISAGLDAKDAVVLGLLWSGRLGSGPQLARLSLRLDALLLLLAILGGSVEVEISQDSSWLQGSSRNRQDSSDPGPWRVSSAWREPGDTAWRQTGDPARSAASVTEVWRVTCDRQILQQDITTRNDIAKHQTTETMQHNKQANLPDLALTRLGEPPTAEILGDKLLRRRPLPRLRFMPRPLL